MPIRRRRLWRTAFATGLALLALSLDGWSQQRLYRGTQASGDVRTVADIRLTDPAQDRDVLVRLHYPADASGPLPLVVYSHGARCSAANYDLITRYWAAQGYAVLAPTHRDAMDNPVQPTPEELPILLPARIRDLSFLLDSLGDIEAQAGLPGLFDRERIAVSGHSFGGMAAQIKSGARIDPAAYIYPGPIADPRYKAAVVMSGVGPMPPFTDDAFDGLTGPVIATGGTLDLGNTGRGVIHPWEWRVAAYDLAPPGDKYRVVLDEGDHYLGGLICRDDRGGPADPRGVEILQATTTAFLDAYLRDDAQALAYLRGVDLAAVTGGRADYLVK